MSLSERNEALAAFRAAQALAAKQDKIRYLRAHPQAEPVDLYTLTAVGRAILRAEAA
jgi:hypothetical protein